MSWGTFLVSGAWWWLPAGAVWIIRRARRRHERSELEWAITGMRLELEAFTIELGEVLTPVLRRATSAFTELAKELQRAGVSGV